MSRYSDQDLNELGRNPNVLKICGSNISYKPKFKIRAVEDYLAGKTPKDIFRAAGINLGLFDPDYAKKALSRWRAV
jgi:transposase-like protein